MVSKKSNTGLVVAGLLLGILMSSMDNTIVSASMPTIIGELGGMDQFIWVTSVYLVATMASMPIFGKLCDMYGRKRFYLLGLAIFLIGSALCGTAQSMNQLIIYRAIQGIGGGSLVPIAFTVIFDIFPPEKRGKMSGLFGAVFGLSGIIGPLLGAVITDQIDWRWVFYINLPLGILSLFFIAQYYKETLQLRKLKIDWFGAFTLVGAVVSLMFALEMGGNQYSWNSFLIISLFIIFIVLFTLFIFIERKVQEPIIPLSLFKKQLFAATQGVAFFYNGAFIVITVLIPLFVQSVYGGTATNSGIILIPLMVASAVGAQVFGQLVSRFSYRSLMLVSVVIFFIGMYLLGSIDTHTSRTLLTIYMVIAGFGGGCSFSVATLATQHNIEPQKRGIATSANTFFRTIGMSIGITILGTIQNHIYKSHLTDATNAMATSISSTFNWNLIVIGLGFICIILMGKERLILFQKEKSSKETVAPS